jgi:hypothetical protein
MARRDRLDLKDIPENVVLNEDQHIFWTYVFSDERFDEEWALVAEVQSGPAPHVCCLQISWSGSIARRVGQVTFYEDNWPYQKSVKKLIILE